MPSLPDVTTSLQAFWSANAPAGVPAYFPGMQVDTSQSEDWIELWVDSADELRRRAASPRQVEVTVTLHCFSRSRRDALRSQALADEVASLLARRSIPVVSPDAPQTTTGYLRIGESRTRNLTRVHAVVDAVTLQHQIVTFSAVASDTP